VAPGRRRRRHARAGRAAGPTVGATPAARHQTGHASLAVRRHVPAPCAGQWPPAAAPAPRAAGGGGEDRRPDSGTRVAGGQWREPRPGRRCRLPHAGDRTSGRRAAMTVRELEVHALYGLTVASEVPLHQSRAVQPSGEPDLVIRWGEPIPRRSTPPEGRVLAHLETDQPYYTFTVTESGEYVLRFYRVCDF